MLDFKTELLTDLIYNSNKIENLDYTREETLICIQDGHGPKEILNHYRVYEQVILASNELPKSIDDVRQIHAGLMNGILPTILCGHFRLTAKIISGTNEILPHPHDIDELGERFDEYMLDVLAAACTKVGPERNRMVIKAAWSIHDFFETIHPFDDGNGRTGRILLNWILWHFNCRTVVVNYKEKEKYFKNIRRWSRHNENLFKVERNCVGGGE